MAYDDGFYYGQCKIICEVETISDNGKTVTVTDGNVSRSGIVADKVFECMVPGRGQYTVSLIDTGNTVKWSGIVEAGYGECIHIMLADGYQAIMERMKLTLDEIAAAPGSVADYIPDADAVKELNSNLTANNQPFRFGYDSVKGKYGYILNQGGADTVIPFKSFDNFEMIYEHEGSGAANITVSGIVQPGDVLFVLLWNSSLSNLQPNRYDGATCTGGTITKLSNLRNVAAYQSGTFYQVNCESNTITLSHPQYTFLYNIFRANL